MWKYMLPRYFKYELVAVCRKIAYQKRVSETIARVQLDDLMSVQTTLHFEEALLIRAYEIAQEHNLPTTYDAQYLALSERLSCEFWTLDERLFNALSSKVSNIRWVGDWQTEV